MENFICFGYAAWMTSVKSAWGPADIKTRLFFELGIERVLKAVEVDGLKTTGRCLQLNSMENRVYEIEIDMGDKKPKNPSDRFRIAKFYRPGRWSKEQILEEHEFLLDLVDNEVPAIAPLKFKDGTTLKELQDTDMWYALFPKRGGRAPDEFSDEQLEQLGRLLARVHNVGATKLAKQRLRLSPDSYGLSNLDYLLKHQCIAKDCATTYENLVQQICQLSSPWFANAPYQRVHGDCHLGNILWGEQGLYLLDFDDMVMAPAVQDIWLLLPGRPNEDARVRHKLNVLLDAYESMRAFDRSSLKLIEALRTLRYIHFSGWIARRWQDPYFQRAFPQFAAADYWQKQVQDLKEQLALLQGY